MKTHDEFENWYAKEGDVAEMSATNLSIKNALKLAYLAGENNGIENVAKIFFMDRWLFWEKKYNG
ncbi:MAG TPA: hypothetical protein EYQ26_15490 [Rhodospirillales bacterium]|nr:hypothetical protein [Rhodospirillales bacterium]